jgi:hypothetical protein
MSEMNKPEIIAMDKAEIIAELENMAVARLFGRQPWLADRETFSAINQKLIQMGLWEEVCVEPQRWQVTPLGKELDLDLWQVFMGVLHEWDVPITLEDYGLLEDSEFDSFLECTSEADAVSLLEEYVKRAYFQYRKRSPEQPHPTLATNYTDFQDRSLSTQLKSETVNRDLLIK